MQTKYVKREDMSYYHNINQVPQDIMSCHTIQQKQCNSTPDTKHLTLFIVQGKEAYQCSRIRISISIASECEELHQPIVNGNSK